MNLPIGPTTNPLPTTPIPDTSLSGVITRKIENAPLPEDTRTSAQMLGTTSNPSTVTLEPPASPITPDGLQGLSNDLQANPPRISIWVLISEVMILSIKQDGQLEKSSDSAVTSDSVLQIQATQAAAEQDKSAGAWALGMGIAGGLVSIGASAVSLGTGVKSMNLTNEAASTYSTLSPYSENFDSEKNSVTDSLQNPEDDLENNPGLKHAAEDLAIRKSDLLTHRSGAFNTLGQAIDGLGQAIGGLSEDEVLRKMLEKLKRDVDGAIDKFNLRYQQGRLGLIQKLNQVEAPKIEKRLLENPELRKLFNQAREERKVELERGINIQAQNLDHDKFPGEINTRVLNPTLGLDLDEPRDYSDSVPNSYPPFSERIAGIDFAKIGNKSRFNLLNTRVGLKRDNRSLVVEYESVSNPTENKLLNLAFKKYVLDKFGPEAVDHLWATNSELSILLKHGGSLGRGDIQKFLKEADQFYIDLAFADQPWANGSPPPENYRPDENRLSALEHKFTGGGLRRIKSETPEWLIDSNLVERYQNKRAILDFMDFLQHKRISPQVQSFIWKEYFAEEFATGGKGLTGSKASSIFKLATELDEASEKNEPNEGILNPFIEGNILLSKEEVRQELASKLQETKDTPEHRSNVKSLLVADLELEKKTPLVPSYVKEANENRAQIYLFMEHLVLKYGPDTAEKIWNSNLEHRALVGMGLSHDEMMGLAKKAQEATKEFLESGQKAIAVFADTELRNSRAVRQELNLDSNAMKRVQEQFKLRANAELILKGKVPTPERLTELALDCIAQMRKVANLTQPQKRVELNNRVKSLRKGFATSESNKLGLWVKELSKDQWKDAFKGLKKLADSSSMSVLAIKSGFKHWLEEGGDIPSQELSERVNRFSTVMDWVQFVGMVEYILGAMVEFKSFKEAIKDNQNIEDSLVLAIANLRLQASLLRLFREIEKNYKVYSEEGESKIAELPSLNEIAQTVKVLEQQITQAENLVLAAFKKETNPGKVRLHAVQYLRYIASLTDITFKLDVSLLRLIPFLAHSESIVYGLDLVSTVGGFIGAGANIVAFGTSAYRTWQDFKGAYQCKRAGKKAQTFSERLFREKDLSRLDDESVNSAFKVHQQYRLAKRTQKKLKSTSNLSRPTSKNLITEDQRFDFAKAISRNQRTGEKFVGGTRNAINSIAYGGSAASFIFSLVKAGTFTGGVAGTSVGPLGTVIGGSVGAVFGLLAGVGTFLAHFAYKNVKAKKIAKQIQGWREALVHRDGQQWEKMKKYGLTDNQCLELAWHKLTRRDPKLALTEMFQMLVEENKPPEKQQKPITAMLKNGFQPHQPPAQKEKSLTEEQILENAQWHATVDRLAKTGNPETIYGILEPLLRPI